MGGPYGAAKAHCCVAVDESCSSLAAAVCLPHKLSDPHYHPRCRRRCRRRRRPCVRMLQLAIVTAVTFVLHGASRAAVGVSRAAGPCAGADASVGLSGTLKLVVRTTPTAHRCTHRSTPLHTAAPIAAPLPTAAHRCPPTAAPTAAHRCAAAHRCTPLHTAAHRRTAAPLHRCAAAHRCIPLHTAAPLHRCTPLHSCTAALPSCPGLFLRPLCRCARSR